MVKFFDIDNIDLKKQNKGKIHEKHFCVKSSIQATRIILRNSCILIQALRVDIWKSPYEQLEYCIISLNAYRVIEREFNFVSRTDLYL